MSKKDQAFLYMNIWWVGNLLATKADSLWFFCIFMIYAVLCFVASYKDR